MERREKIRDIDLRSKLEVVKYEDDTLKESSIRSCESLKFDDDSDDEVKNKQ